MQLPVDASCAQKDSTLRSLTRVDLPVSAVLEKCSECLSRPAPRPRPPKRFPPVQPFRHSATPARETMHSSDALSAPRRYPAHHKKKTRPSPTRHACRSRTIDFLSAKV